MSTVLYAALIVAALVVVAVVLSVWSRKQRARRPKSRSSYASALDALIQGRDEEALALLKQAVEQDSGNVDAYLKLGNLLRKKGKTVKALQIHRELSLRDIADRRTLEAVYEGLTEDYIAAGRYEKAVETAERLKGMNRESVRNLATLGRVYELTKQWDRAYECQVELGKLRGWSDGRHLARYKVFVAEQLLKEGRLKEARKKAREALKLDPDTPGAHICLGDICAREENLVEALQEWCEFSRKHPSRAFLVFDRVEKAYFDQGKFSEMLDYFEDLLSREPQDVNVLVALAEMRYKKGESDEAVRNLQDAVAADPRNMTARLMLAIFLGESEKHDESIEHLKGMLGLLRDSGRRYRCKECGFESPDFTTRCASCGVWDPFF